MRNHLKVCLCYGLTYVFLCGCVQSIGERHFYLLDVVRDNEPVKQTTGRVLMVEKFEVSPRFKSKGFVYRVSKFGYESDYYNEFFVWPETLIIEETQEWLSASGLFDNVVNPGSQVQSTHLLRGEVKALYGDFSSKSSWKAIMEIRFMLTDTSSAESGVLLEKTYKVAIPLPSKYADSLVEAHNNCLKQILFQLERDLVEQL